MCTYLVSYIRESHSLKVFRVQNAFSFKVESLGKSCILLINGS